MQLVLPSPSAIATTSTAPTPASTTISAHIVTTAPTTSRRSEVLALRRSTLSVLLLGIEIFRRVAAGRTILTHVLFVLLGVGLAVWMLLLIARLVLLRRSLTIRVLLFVVLLVLLAGVHTAPASIPVGFLPSGSCVLVYIPVVSRVHVANRVLPRVRVSIRAG